MENIFILLLWLAAWSALLLVAGILAECVLPAIRAWAWRRQYRKTADLVIFKRQAG